MKVEVEGKTYETKYFPFFRTKRKKHYDVYTLRYPSGFTDKIVVLDKTDYMYELKKYLEFIIKEYLLEDEICLTPQGIRLKNDVYELFH